MGITDPKTDGKVVMCLDPVTLAAAATTDCASIDTLGFRWATFVIQLGTDGGTMTAASAKITQDTATGGAFATDVTGATFNAITMLAADCIVIGRVDLLKTYQFLRAEITLAGTVTGTPASAMVILTGPEDSTLYQTATYDFAV